MERLLPRHMQIIYAINARVLTEARHAGATDAMIASVSIIDEGHGRRVRMGNLAFVGSHKVNGVSALHSELMKETVFKDLNALFPGRITNKTNGITPRRWLLTANPGLTSLIRETIGDAYLDNAEKLVALEPYATDPAFQERFGAVKHANKARLAKLIQQTTGLRVDPSAMFDVQIKRIHEYKRQLLNILETVALYDAIRAHPEKDWAPRVKMFSGKAAASYTSAKYVIKLINDVARVVNSDPSVRNLLKVVFLPNYNVSLAEVIIPAADLSEQISTAGMEASGTGNMKFALNGALTIGTLDGANVEMLRACRGREHLHLRPDGRRGRGTSSQGPQPQGQHRRPSDARGGARRGRVGGLLPQRSRAPSRNRRGFAQHRLVHGDGRLRRFCRGPARRGCAVAHAGPVAAKSHPQRRPHGVVLLRPDDPGLCRRDLGGFDGKAGLGPCTRPACACRSQPVPILLLTRAAKPLAY